MKKSTIAKKIRAKLLILFNCKLIISLWFVLIAGVLSSQTVNQLDFQISTMLSSSDPSVVSQGQHLQSLVTNMHPTAYLTQGEITIYGEGAPAVAICDAASVSLLYGNNPTLSQIEIIRFTVDTDSELPSSIDLTQLLGLADMKYLLVVFAYDACGAGSEGCLVSIVEGIIQGTSSQITVMYSLSIPE